MKTTQINCPNCHTSIDVQDILAQQLEEEIGQKYKAQLAAEKAKFNLEYDNLNAAKQQFEEARRKQNELFQERLEKQLREDRKTIETRLRQKLNDEQSEQFQALQKELNEKSEQVKELNRSKAEIEKLKREKGELKEVAEAEAQKKLNEQLLAEKEKIRKSEEDKNELRFKELQKQLEDQKRLTEEMKRKQEQGSMQLQGEVQELAIEEWLAEQFPLDTIEEIKKGARGGDCIQVVNTRSRQNCGKIYYESKRTKEFHPSWIEKFKADMREKGADIGVLVTEAMPSNFETDGHQRRCLDLLLRRVQRTLRSAPRIRFANQHGHQHARKQGRQNAHALRLPYEQYLPHAGRSYRGRIHPNAHGSGERKTIHAADLEATRKTD